MAKKKNTDKYLVLHYINDNLVSYAHANEVEETDTVKIVSEHKTEEEAKEAQKQYAEENKLNHQYI